MTLVDWIRQTPGIKAEVQVDRLDDDGTIVEKWNLRLSRDERYPLEIPSATMRPSWFLRSSNHFSFEFAFRRIWLWDYDHHHNSV